MITCPNCGAEQPEPTPELMTRTDLKTMTARQIEDARQSGRLDHLLGTTTKGTNQ